MDSITEKFENQKKDFRRKGWLWINDKNIEN